MKGIAFSGGLRGVLRGHCSGFMDPLSAASDLAGDLQLVILLQV